jgi:hypothetical protein
LEDEGFLEGASGLEFGVEGFEQCQEIFTVLLGQDEDAGSEAVLDGVTAHDGFPVRGLRAGAELGVAAAGLGFSLGGHGTPPATG